MSEMDEKLNAILSNPQMMQQIMSLAQTLNTNGIQQDAKGNASTQPTNAFELNPTMLGKLSSFMQQGSIDQNQQSLLKALSPYLSRPKLQKLERAMHAAKMAGLATQLTNSRNQSFHSGR